MRVSFFIENVWNHEMFTLFLVIRNTENHIPSIEEFRTLGRTGFRGSSIGIGSSNHQDNFYENLIETGMYYFDTSPLYRNEELVGKAISSVDRESVFVTVKFFPKKFSRSEFFANRQFTKEDVLHSFRYTFKIKSDYLIFIENECVFCNPYSLSIILPKCWVCV